MIPPSVREWIRWWVGGTTVTLLYKVVDLGFRAEQTADRVSMWSERASR